MFGQGLALRNLLLSPLPPTALEVALDLLGAGVAPLDPEGVEFKEEAISVSDDFSCGLDNSCLRSLTSKI